jgi:hypothetical protein
MIEMALWIASALFVLFIGWCGFILIVGLFFGLVEFVESLGEQHRVSVRRLP